MSKREHGHAIGTSEAEGSRPKRRRETAGASSDIDVTQSEISPTVQSKSDGDGPGKELVKEQGLKMWQTVKDAVNKEGRSLTLDFMRKPSERLYANYYQVIQTPIALDDIKKQLDHGGYTSLEAVKQDFELCFNNAKQYNIKESVIWKDAKDLLKLVQKTYNKLAPLDDNEENGDGDGEKRGKSKAPNLNRLIKSRLRKLVDRTDSGGRVMSAEFMELPSKKDWPAYYKEIKRPQCLENIFKRIKRKEYHTSAEFAADVELVFSNAMTFNQEHTLIWEDARSLRDNFRLLMSDLPPPYAIENYAKPSNGKIKIKMPPAMQQSAIPPAQPADTPVTTSFLLRVPKSNMTKDAKIPPAATPTPTSTPTPTPILATASLPAAVPLAAPSVPVLVQPTQTPAPTAPSQPFIFSHYPNASYIPPDGTATVANASSSSHTVPTESEQEQSTSKSPPAAPIHHNHQLKTVVFTTRPNSRNINLDYRDGVKNWAMRLGAGETGLQVGSISFLRDEEGESSAEEEPDVEPKIEEEEEEAIDINLPMNNGKKKGKGRGRGRPKGSTKAAMTKAKAITPKKQVKKLGPLELKLNGVLIKRQDNEEGSWIVDLQAGSNVVEVGETGGLIWKAYVERMEDA